MSKAEERAWEWACKNKLDPYSMGQAYGEGYHQAEKDLELTWEDIALINDIVTTILRECKDEILLYDTKEEFNKEVLKRFKVQKGK